MSELSWYSSRQKWRFFGAIAPGAVVEGDDVATCTQPAFPRAVRHHDFQDPAPTLSARRRGIHHGVRQRVDRFGQVEGDEADRPVDSGQDLIGDIGRGFPLASA